MENESAKGKSWNSYACPGCRKAFRVAIDFLGEDVKCPSCHEILRLPKKPTDAPSHPHSEPSPPPAPSSTVDEQEPIQTNAEPAWRALFTSPGGRKKLSFALGIPLLLVAVVLMLKPAKETPAPAAPSVTSTQEALPTTTAPVPEIDTSQIADLVPEVIENEAPPAPATPPLPEPEQVSELADEAEAPAAVTAEPASKDTEKDLVEAVPATSPTTPAPEKSTQAGARHHTVVRGDTLIRIARKYSVEPKAIMRANGMKDDVVRLGTKLTIPRAEP